MNYYAFHIGDFNSATRHLTRIERSVYRDLIDLYYDTEKALTLDFTALCRLIIAHSDEERTAVEQVLNEFFTRTEHGWFHPRCDEDIQKYHANIAAKSAAGKASAASRAKKTAKKANTRTTSVEHTNNSEGTAVQQVLSECATNQEPITNNQEPNKTPLGNSQANASAETARKRRRLPNDFELTSDRARLATSYWQEKGRTDLSARDEFAKFAAYHRSKGTTMLDWDAAWQTWYSNAVGFTRPAGKAAPSHDTAAEWGPLL